MKKAPRKILPDPSDFCKTFTNLSVNIWQDLYDGIKHGVNIGEESITDFFLLSLKRMHPSPTVTVHKFTRIQEGRKTGADWEWWFGADKKWFGIRIQAKKLDSDLLEYSSLDKFAGKTGKTQVSLLIQDAKRRRLYPMYCFYNYWRATNTVQECRCCKSRRCRTASFGCTLADARLVGVLVRMGFKDLTRILGVSFPLRCLVCSRIPFQPSTSLPERVRGSIQNQLPGTDDLLPEVRSKPPKYVRILQSRSGVVDVLPRLPSRICGILVMTEESFPR